MPLDRSTFLLVIGLLCVWSAASTVFLFLGNRNEPGIKALAIGLVLQGLGGVIHLFSGAVPSAIHAVIGCTLLVGAAAYQLRAVRLLCQREVPTWQAPAACLAALVVFAGLHFGLDSLRVRYILLGLLVGAGFLAAAWELVQKGHEETWPGPRLLCMGVYTLHALANLAWAYFAFAAPRGLHDPEGACFSVVSFLATLPVGLFAGFGFAVLLGERLLARQRHLALTDLLTGLPNRRGFMEQVNRAFHRAQAAREPLGLLVMDVDHFKAINDRFGHAAGDAALAAFSQRVLASLRESDVAGRIGGEEFAVLLRWTNLMDGMHVAERIRRAVADQPVLVRSKEILLSVSIGVACSQEGVPDLDGLFRLADRRLYRAKEEGRNQVVGFGLETHTQLMLPIPELVSLR